MQTKSLHQSVFFEAKPKQLFEALMDSKQHTAFTREAAVISKKVGGKIFAYGDYIDGKNIELVEAKKIVQSWRASDWPSGHYSTVAFLFKNEKSGCRLEFSQDGIPASQLDSIQQGWIDFYWNPLKAFFKKRKK